MTETNTLPQWATAKQLPVLQPAFSESAIRWHIFNARQNGLQPHIRRVGRKVLINVAGFGVWIASQGASGEKP